VVFLHGLFPRLSLDSPDQFFSVLKGSAIDETGTALALHEGICAPIFAPRGIDHRPSCANEDQPIVGTDVEYPCVPLVLWYRFRMQFIVPAQPKVRTSPPLGNAWIHEVKFDGWRVQLHKYGHAVGIYTKNGTIARTRSN
jgi:hypothetical protein